jgi:hypothetical protein
VVDVRWLFLSLISLCFASLSHGQVVLNEVLYDPSGSDEGFEFVEIVNVSDDPQSLSGYALEFHDGASENWVAVWEAGPLDTVAGGDLFVIGGAAVLPLPDAVDELSLQNGPDAVRLMRDGLVVDLLGYGTLAPEFCEGTSAPDVPSGSSLSRRPDGEDTGDNAADFDAAAPSPGRYNVTRSDVALRLGEETPRNDALLGAQSETFVFMVVNIGSSPVEPGTIAVSLADSSGPGAPRSMHRTVAAGIPSGDSIRVELELELEAGDHHVRALASYPPDEHPEDNFVELRRRVGSSALMVSEVMSDPRDECPEYIELYNSAAVSYELSGHSIRDCAHSSSLIVGGSALIPPDGFIVLTDDSVELLACFAGLRPDAVLQIEGAWPSLNQTSATDIADSIVVLDPSELPVERVAYPPQPADTQGRSLERIDLFPTFGKHTWVLSSAGSGGSPGRRSPVSRASAPEDVRLAASPNPFDPYRSEYLVVTVSARNAGERVVLDVFDIEGKRIAVLGTTNVLPTTFVWDGKDSSGRTVLPGIYILSCEFVPVDRGSRHLEKVVVGCGRRKNSSPRE